MAKTSAVEKNKRRRKLAAQFASKRSELGMDEQRHIVASQPNVCIWHGLRSSSSVCTCKHEIDPIIDWVVSGFSLGRTLYILLCGYRLKKKEGVYHGIRRIFLS